MEYHIIYIVIAFILLLFTVILLVENNTKEKTIWAALLAGINYNVCLIATFGFFGIGIIGVSGDGSVTVTAYHDMYSFYAIMYLLHWVNVGLMFYCYWLWVRKPWELDKAESSEP